MLKRPAQFDLMPENALDRSSKKHPSSVELYCFTRLDECLA